MELLVINDNDYGQNIYLYYDAGTGEGVIIDPGDSFEAIRDVIKQKNIKVKAILLTHGHFDHTFRVNEIRELAGAPVYAHEAETRLLADPEFNRSGYRGLNISVVPDKSFTNGEVFPLASGNELEVIHTPGHTAGGVCYYDKKNRLLFTGDTLFKGTIGRTDMPTGNYATLLDSIKERLFVLPDNVKVLPGHDASSTIGNEKKSNRAMGVNFS